MAARQEQINLLPGKGFEATTGGRILAWILSTFRIIVIVTEVIVMVAFLSRFWLDAQNTDLAEEIEEKQAVLSASLNFEKQFKDAQKRLEIFSTLTSKGELFNQTLTTITSHLPDDLFLTSLSFKESGSEEIKSTKKASQIDIEGASPNERSIQQFLVNLDSSNQFSSIVINQIKADPENPILLIFRIGAQFAKEKEVTQ